MIVKKHTNEGRLVLAVCDEDLLGKRFEDEEKILDLSSSFYRGSKMEPGELKETSKKCYMINAVGEGSISFLKELGLVKEETIKSIMGVPYAIVIFAVI